MIARFCNNKKWAFYDLSNHGLAKMRVFKITPKLLIYFTNYNKEFNELSSN